MKHNYAVAGINTTSLTMLRAVQEAAEEEGTPVILSHAQLHEPYAPIELMGPLMKAAAEKILLFPVLFIWTMGQQKHIFIRR